MAGAWTLMIGAFVAPVGHSANPGANGPSIVPRPAQMKVLPGAFQLTESTPIQVAGDDPQLAAVADLLAEALQQRTRFRLRVAHHAQPDGLAGGIVLQTTADTADADDASYTLVVNPDHVSLSAPQPRGVFYATQTLQQTLTNVPAESSSAAAGPHAWRLPCVEIHDRPRYRWRGMLLDCGRHFMDVALVKRYVDLLALHKMNVLHWHLTEDQGWRIEIKRYPALTGVGAWRGTGVERYGGFYTQEDIRDIVAYAARRFVTVVPEIELPGHCGAALAAMPELSCTGGPFEVSRRWGVHQDLFCAGNDATFEFLENVLDEVLALFPSRYVHIGGDECPKQCWAACPKCQARMRAAGLADEDALQSYFIKRIEAYLSSRGRRLVGWDEILEGGLAPNATVQSWRGMQGAIAAATAGHDVISSPTSHCYLDYAQARLPGEPTWMGYLPLAQCYAFEPTPTELTPAQAHHVLGLEANMWTEHAPPSRVDWQVFPRLCALAEVAWSPPDARDYADFTRRMRVHYRRLDALGVTYFIPPPTIAPETTTFDESIVVELINPLGIGDIRYTLDGREPSGASTRYEDPLQLTESTTLKARIVLPNGRRSAALSWQLECRPPQP
jgi:hexosaminidase